MHSLRRLLIPTLLFAASAFVGCGDDGPSGSPGRDGGIDGGADGGTDGPSDGGAGGDASTDEDSGTSGDLITITFESEFGTMPEDITTSGTVPSALTVAPGTPVRLPEGSGLGIESGSGEMYAAGWTTLTAEEQGAAGLPRFPSADVFIATYEYTFTEDTTLYPRWTRDPVRIVYMLDDFDTGDPIPPLDGGPVYDELDEITLETWAEFSARMDPPFSVPGSFEIFEWRATSVSSYPSSFGRKPGRSELVSHFDPSAGAGPIKGAYLTYALGRVYTVSFQLDDA